MAYYLAQINIGRILGPIDSPVMAEFVANLDSINTLAENADGFIWRLKEENNNATSIKWNDDAFIIVNMSVWKDIDSLGNFVYKSNHVEFFKKRKQWFEKMKEMYLALWYVPAGHKPTVTEARERLEYLKTHGETPYAFTFKKRFTSEESLSFRPV